ncbi:D27 [Scenedesmus sp. PABB004]|nr:D27 [Scenedesmus sp. PABB004]
MGLPLTMTPNYDDFSCQFAFGKTPRPQHLDEAFATPCFQQCPSRAPRYADVAATSGGGSSGAAPPNNCPNILRSQG